MRRLRIWYPLALLLTAACSDPVAESIPSPLEELPNDRPTLPVLIVSEPRAEGTPAGAFLGSSAGVAYVALPPGSLPTVVAVRIRNLARSDEGVTVQVIDGGFDPVAITAAGDDELELALREISGSLTFAYARVPVRRPPVVVRTYPPKGRTDVALGIIPTIVFSEPVDARSLATGVRLFRGPEEVVVAVEIPQGEPWGARVLPTSDLDPGAAYELRITRAVQDLEGDSLEVALVVPFSTAPAQDPPGEPPPPQTPSNTRIAFLRSSGGSDVVVIANGDGSGAAELQVLEACGDLVWHTPRLSPDGTRVLVSGGGMNPEGTCVIGLDGSNRRFFPDVYDNPKWSPDGTRLLYYGWNGFIIRVVDALGGLQLLSQDALPGAGPRGPGEYRSASGEWLDENTIGFVWDGGIWAMDADGSNVRRVGTAGADFDVYSVNWSPDGSRIAFAGPDPANGSPRVIGSMAADGTDVRVHFTSAAGVAAPEWSPDGRLIAFHTSGLSARIYVVDVQTGAAAQLVPEAGAVQGTTYYDWAVSWAAIRE